MNRSILSILVILISLRLSVSQDNDGKDSLGLLDYISNNVVDKLTYSNKKMSISTYPLIGYSEQLGVSVGIMPIVTIDDNLNKKFKRPTYIVPVFLYTSKKYLDIELDFTSYFKNWVIQFSSRYYQFYNNFYGINAKELDKYSEYYNDIFYMIGRPYYMIEDVLFLGFTFEFREQYIKDIQSDILNSNVLGYEGGRTFGLGPSIKYDSRDDILYPSKGNLIVVQSKHFLYVLGDYKFNEYSLVLSKFFSIVDKKNIVGFNFQMTIKDGNIPFYHMSRLGGDKKLRHLGEEDMFLDENMYLSQIEYRRFLHGRFYGVLFLGLGNIFDNTWDNLFDDMKYSIGAGLRFKITSDLNLNFRVDFSMGSHKQRSFWLKGGEAF